MIRKTWLSQPEDLTHKEDNDKYSVGKIIYEEGSLVPAAPCSRNQEDPQMDVFQAACLVNGQQLELVIDNGSSTNLVAR